MDVALELKNNLDRTCRKKSWRMVALSYFYIWSIQRQNDASHFWSDWKKKELYIWGGGGGGTVGGREWTIMVSNELVFYINFLLNVSFIRKGF